MSEHRVLEAEARHAAYGIAVKLEQLQDAVGRGYGRNKLADELVEIIDPRIRERRLQARRDQLAKFDKEMADE